MTMYVSERLGDRMISLEESAEILGVSLATVRRHINDGSLTPQKARYRVALDRDQVIALREQRHAAKAQSITEVATPAVAAA